MADEVTVDQYIEENVGKWGLQARDKNSIMNLIHMYRRQFEIRTNAEQMVIKLTSELTVLKRRYMNACPKCDCTTMSSTMTSNPTYTCAVCGHQWEKGDN